MTRIGLIQFDILWEDAVGNIEKVRALTELLTPVPDLLILPELWICGFTMNLEAHKTFEAGLAFMQELSGRYGSAVLGGLPAKTATGQENRCYLATPDGVRSYAKIKAFKFAGEHLKYEPGGRTHRWDVAGFKLSPFICYDLRFPELARQMVPETNLITYVANWPSARIHHWRKLLVARAIENLCYVVGVNRTGRDGAGLEYTGDSLVVGPTGEILLDPGNREGVFFVDIDAAEVGRVRAQWPFLSDI